MQKTFFVCSLLLLCLFAIPQTTHAAKNLSISCEAHGEKSDHPLCDIASESLTGDQAVSISIDDGMSCAGEHARISEHICFDILEKDRRYKMYWDALSVTIQAEKNIISDLKTFAQAIELGTHFEEKKEREPEPATLNTTDKILLGIVAGVPIFMFILYGVGLLLEFLGEHYEEYQRKKERGARLPHDAEEMSKKVLSKLDEGFEQEKEGMQEKYQEYVDVEDARARAKSSKEFVDVWNRYDDILHDLR